MRVKDDKKQEALLLATVKIVNEIGFAASSVAKIAKQAEVSPATLYVYYKNKEDLLVSTYVEIKISMAKAIFDGLDTDLPVRDVFQEIWHNLFDYIHKNHEEFRFAEQFSNSPYSHLVNREELEKLFLPMIEVIDRGIQQKIIKNVSKDILSAFIFYPAIILASPHLCKDFKISRESVRDAFQLAWDAIKL